VQVCGWEYRELQPHQEQVIVQGEKVLALLQSKLQGQPPLPQ
jgi:hypothetical protein